MELSEIAKFIRFREDLPFLFNRLELKGRGVEIGVQRGEFSKKILENWEGEKLYLIDIWCQVEGYEDVANVSHNQQLDNLAHTFMNVYHYGNRATIIREGSVAASELFQDGSLDFVFIDADHSYQAVRADIAAWAPKVKAGGILCGHDYLDSPFKENQIGEFGVKSAVDEWAGFVGKTIYSTDKEAFPFWWTQL